VPRLGRGPAPPGVVIETIQPSATRRVSAVWRADTAGRPAVGAAVRVLRAASTGMRQ
jgi:hypothetical protein